MYAIRSYYDPVVPEAVIRRAATLAGGLVLQLYTAVYPLFFFSLGAIAALGSYNFV